ncbi:MAG: hypothetical protein FJ005_07600 [Chloroflexi bacterium]|nr:hypothetical protein [Chloroflexota bacterium]
MSLDSDSPEWSESLIVLGRGVDTWSQRYRTRTHCIVGIGEVSGLLRLYPLFTHERAEKFDLVHAVIQDENPEAHRPESRKIYPNSIRVIGQEDSKPAQRHIIKSLCDTGECLHAEGWRSQTIVIIRSVKPHFWITKRRKLMVRCKCGMLDCKGHVNEVLGVIKVDKVGRRWRPKSVWLEKYIKTLLRKELYFVMGTHRNHPHRWVLIAIHSFAISTHREKEGSAIQAKGGTMQVSIIVTDDYGRSETFQLDRIKTTKNYVKFGAGDMGKPVISTIYIAKDFKATKKTKKS